MKIVPITVFQTEDGKTFATENEAKRHELRKQINDLLHDISQDGEFDLIDDCLDELARRRDELHALLTAYDRVRDKWEIAA
jgi:hypothetical protein